MFSSHASLPRSLSLATQATVTLAALLGLALGPALVRAPRALADDKPAAPSPAPTTPPRFACAVGTKVMDEAVKEQENQFHLCEKLAELGFSVDSRVATKYDKFLKKAGCTVPTPPAPPADATKPDEKKPDAPKPDAPKAPEKKDAPAPDYTVEGSIDLHYKPTTFMGKTQSHNFLAKVDVKIKDAKGTVVQTISFEHYDGATIPTKQEDVARSVEGQAGRFLVCKLLKLEIVASNVPEAKKAAYKDTMQMLEKDMADNLKAPPKGLK